MTLAAQQLREGKITSEEFMNEMMSGFLYLEAQAHPETKAILVDRVQEGTLSSQDAVDAMITMYKHLIAQDYPGMKELIANTRVSISLAQANAARQDVMAPAAREEFYQRTRSDFELHFPGSSPRSVFDGYVQSWFDKEREVRVSRAQVKQTANGKRKRT